MVPGGFSFGDYLRAGAIARFSPVMESVIEFAREGGPVLGICNGFQVLCEAGLLPGALLAERVAALRLPPGRGRRSRTTRHAVHASRATRRRAGCRSRSSTRPAATSRPTSCSSGSRQSGQVRVPLRAGTEPERLACATSPGVVNEAGNVVGLMPHPEHAVDALTGSTDGLELFRSLAAHLCAVPRVTADSRPTSPAPRRWGSASPHPSTSASASCSAASRTSSSWRSSRCCGPSTAPTSTRASCCASCRRRASAC